MSTTLPDPIRNFLSDFVARLRRLALVKAAALALAVFLAVLLMACTVDRFAHLPRTVRGVLLLVDVLAVVLVLRRPVADALRPRADWIEAAAQVEAVDSTFAQRLMTVTSQIQSNPLHRGSSGMLAALVEEVSAVVSQKRGAEMLTFARIRRSITLAGCFLAVTLATLVMPWLQMPRLMQRFTRPWANLPPVTTTQLSVTPGSTVTAQGRPLRVTVAALALDDSPVQLHVQHGDDWVVSQLDSRDPEHFAGDTPPLDRDTRYFVTGGDARSETFDVHVLTTPGLKDIRARVEYPPYLNLAAKTITIVDGKLEVPVGSAVTLSLIATEPLSAATLIGPAGQREATAASVDPAVRVVKLLVKKDFIATVVLKSSQGVEQKVAQPLSIRPIPDHPPFVRLLTPPQELRMTPIDLLTTAGQALDDYGVESLNLQIKINDRPPVYQAIPITGDRKRIEQAIECDLAGLSVEPGDFLQLVLLARDGAGQQVGSETLRITISPRSFDLNDYLRLVDLKSALKLADDLKAQLNAAREGLGQSPDSIAKDGDKTLQNLSATAQSAQLLTMPLLRAATRADLIELGDAVGNWLDAAEQSRSIAEELQDQRARKLDPNQLSGPLELARRRIDSVIDQLGKAVKREQFLAIRGDATAARELSLRASKSKGADRDKLRAAAAKLQASAQAAARAAGVNLAEDAGSFPELEAVIGDALSVMRVNPRIDYANVSREWQGVLQHVSAGNLLATRSSLEVLAMEGRLAIASQAESVRPGADYVRARDWSLAARAAQAISAAAVTPGVPEAVKSAVGEYPAALTDLQAEHAMHRAAQQPGDAPAVLAKAHAAREKMRRWADNDDAKSAADQLASLDAAAALQKREFDKAKAIDQARASAGKSAKALDAKKQQQLQTQTAAAQRLQSLQQQQQKLAQQTAELIAKATPQEAADRQRLKSMAQQQLKMAQAIQEARQQQEGKSKVGDEKKPIDPVELIAAARLELAELRKQNTPIRTAKDDAGKLEQAKQVDPAGVDAANQNLTKISPIADDAQKQIEDKVVGGSRQLQQEARDKNVPAVAQKSAELDAAIVEAMKKLNAAEEKLAERDAMAAAQSAAQQAAMELAKAADEKGDDEHASQQQPKTPGKQSGNPSPAQPGPMTAQDRADAMAAAQQAQARTMSALDRAVGQAVMGGGQARVRESPLLDSLFSLLPVLIDGSGGGAGTSTLAKLDLPAAREWGRLRPRDDPNQTAVTTPADPVGYEQSLRLYFEALGREK